MSTNELDSIRRDIEAIDFQLLKCIELRASLVRSAAVWKARHGLPFEDRERERTLIDKIISLGTWTLPRPRLREVYRSVIDLCKETAVTPPASASAPHSAENAT